MYFVFFVMYDSVRMMIFVIIKDIKYNVFLLEILVGVL